MPLTVDVDGGLVQADTRTTMPQPPRRGDVDWSAQRMRPPSLELGAGPTVCWLLCFGGVIVWGVERVSILGIRCCVCCQTCGVRLTVRVVGGEADVEWTGVFHMCGRR